MATSRYHTKEAYHAKDNAAFTRKKSSDRVDSVHNSSLTEHERAIEALKMMKEIERQKKAKMVSVQADPRTVISSTEKRAMELTAEYLDKKL